MEDNINSNPNYPLKPTEGYGNNNPPPPPPPQIKCPRCNSSNTRFSYFNNYTTTQPRYRCKNCHRFWTLGGTLRDVPVGGGCRKNKVAKTSIGQSSTSNEGTFTQSAPPPLTPPYPILSQGLWPTGVVSGNSYHPPGAMLSSQTTIQSINQPSLATFGNGDGFVNNYSMIQGVNFSAMRPHISPPQFNTQYLSIQQGFMSSRNPGFVNMGGASTSAGVRGNLVVNDDDRQFNQNCFSDNAAYNHPGFDHF